MIPSWLRSLRKVPVIGWLVAIIAVLAASLMWALRNASSKEKKIRVAMELSSAVKDHEKKLKELSEEDTLRRSQVKAIASAEIGTIKARAAAITEAEKEDMEKLSNMVNEMFKK